MALTVLTTVWAFSLQLLVLAAAAWSASAVLGHRAPWLRQLVWRAGAALALASPVLSALPSRPGVPQSASAVWHIERAAALVGFSQGGNAAATSWPAIALAILIVGGVARLAWLLVGAISLMRLRGLPARPSPVFDQLRTELSVDARLVVADVSQPFTFGLRLPTVVMPDDFFARAVEVQRSVFTHELLHVRRRDWGPACIEHVFAALLWFHPAAWFLVRELRQVPRGNRRWRGGAARRLAPVVSRDTPGVRRASSSGGRHCPGVLSLPTVGPPRHGSRVGGSHVCSHGRRLPRPQHRRSGRRVRRGAHLVPNRICSRLDHQRSPP